MVMIIKTLPVGFEQVCLTKHSVRIRNLKLVRDPTRFHQYICDLRMYYYWIDENLLRLAEHWVYIINEPDKLCHVMFSFHNPTDAVAFKLRWL